MAKLLLIKGIVAISILIFTSDNLNAQNYTGVWHGYITASENGVQFYNSGYTLNIKSQQGDIITGRSYIYGQYTLKFEGLLDFIGTVRNKENKSSLTELKVVQYKTSNDTFKLCIKLADMDFTHKDGIDYLTGNWNGSTENGSNCAPGRVYLQRYNAKKPDGIEPIPADVMKMITDNESPKMRFLQTELMTPIIINVSNSHIQFKLEDYMREDMDTVSVYFNREPLLSKVQIAKKPRSFAVRLDKRSELAEIIMYAENLGKIPPNTSNLTIIDGEKKYKILIQSTKEKSAVIYLRYTDKTPVTPPKGPPKYVVP
jgi:hypothetical protein